MSSQTVTFKDRESEIMQTDFGVMFTSV